MEILGYLIPIAALFLCIWLKLKSNDEIQTHKTSLYDWKFELALECYNNLPQDSKRNYVDMAVLHQDNDTATRLKEVYFKEMNEIAKNRIKNLK